jgi:hypothetical protein
MNSNSVTAGPTSDEPVQRWPKHAVWMGLLITLAGFLSYFLYFYRFPATRDFPVVNLPIVVLGVALTAGGCWGVFKYGHRSLRKALAGLSLLLSLGVAGLLSFYVFYYSYQLPAAVGAPALEAAAPDFTLLDQSGKEVTLSELRGKKVIIDFYRGNW